ncbi:MAG TPA: phosphatidate cytidylyltransferase, partial [candidate division Zixibacteria bacterium]|nr:phosphatidate cytidylyltransferase [candidate division Zixibacteria bacterium]
MTNALGLLIAYIYIFGIIGLAELLRRWRGYGSDFTRKVIHIGVGMLSWIISLLFSSPWPFVLASMTFVVINLIDWRYGIISAMSSSDRSNLGTVYFPLAAAAAALIFWEKQPLMVAALMPLTWGDGLAPVIGRKYGKHTYTIMSHTRSIEGSAAFFVAGGFFTWLALWLKPGSPELTPAEAFLPALVVIAATTL